MRALGLDRSAAVVGVGVGVGKIAQRHGLLVGHEVVHGGDVDRRLRCTSARASISTIRQRG
jgi:hypothetical protein